VRVLIACEWSGMVRDAFIRAGHSATSCDFLAGEGTYTSNHIQGDAIAMLHRHRHRWDLMIAFPPCTYLCSSGLHWNTRRPERQALTDHALRFVRLLMDADIPRIVVENPAGCIGSKIRPADQYIQPWQFGSPESKRTGLWLKNLPLLQPTKIMEIPKSGRWQNQTLSGQNRLGPSPDRAKLRGKTYPGIADAMAEQWGIQE